MGGAGHAGRRRAAGRGVAGAGAGAAVRRPAAATPSCPPACARTCGPTSATGFDWLAFLWQPPARRGSRRRHGAGQDRAGPGADLPRPAGRARTRRRSWWSRRPAWWRTGRPRPPGSRPSCAVVTVAETAAAPRPGPRPRPSRARTSSSPRTRCSGSTSTPTPGSRWSGADPRRGAVRQEPPGEDLPVRPAAAGAVQAGDHRHPDGEQPDGAVVAAVDHRAGPVPAARTGSASYYHRRSRTGGDAERLAQLRRRIRPLVLRRTKEQVAADLPAEAGAGARGRAATRGTAASTSRTCSGSGRRCSA